MNQAIQLIAKESERQIVEEGFTPEHDAQHKNGELSQAAAAAYAAAEVFRKKSTPTDNCTPYIWPFEKEWWKPSPDDRIRELVKAGALIVAEITRLLSIEDASISPTKKLQTEFIVSVTRHNQGEPFLSYKQVHDHYPSEDILLKFLLACDREHPHLSEFETTLSVDKIFRAVPA